MDERARVRENPNMRDRSALGCLVWLVVAACAPTETAFVALEDEPCARDESRRNPDWARDVDGVCAEVSVCSSASTRATPSVTGGSSVYCYEERSTSTRVVFREQDADVLLSSGFERCAEVPEPCE